MFTRSMNPFLNYFLSATYESTITTVTIFIKIIHTAFPTRATPPRL